MEDVDDFNSSDISTPPNTPVKWKDAGKDSIKAMIANKFQDRRHSKQFEKSLSDVRGAPGSQYLRHLWLQRYLGWASTIPDVDSTKPPTSIEIIRFLDTVIGKLVPCGRKKPAPSRRTIVSGLAFLFMALKFKYNFKPTTQDSARIDSALDRFVQQKRLVPGRWREKQWLGFLTMQKITHAYFRHILDHGCLSWDIPVSKALSVNLIAALDSRAGEVAKSWGWDVECCMLCESIVLKMQKEGDVNSIVAEVQVHHQKGEKGLVNTYRFALIEAYSDPELNVVCPIKLILAHGLRNGLFADATTLPDLLEQTWRYRDQTIRWKYPKRPIIPSIQPHDRARLFWQKPANVPQVRATIKQMGLIAGVLVPITTHHIRAGGAKDIAHLPQELKGAPNPVSMKALGHSRLSFASGVADEYVPDLDVSTNAAKALAPFVDRRAPQFAAEPFQPSRPGKRRQSAHLAELGLDPATPHTAKKIARLEHDRWVQQQKDAPKEKRSTRQRQALRQHTSSENNVLARPASPTLDPRLLRPGSTEEGGGEEALERFLEDVDQDPFGDCPPQPVEDPNILRHPMDNDRHIRSFLTPSDIIEEQDHPLGQTESQYPPLEDLEFMTVDDSDLQSLQDIIAGVHIQEEEQTDGSANEGHAAQSVATIVDSVNASTFDENAAVANDRVTRELMETQLCSVEGYPQLLLPPHEFVTFLSEINVVRNISLASGPQTSWKERAPQYVDVGNSRSPPEPFVFVCPNIIYGCDYTSYRLSSVMDQHLYRCPKQPVAVAHAAGTISDSEAFESNQESKPAQQRFVCDRDKCDKSYTLQSNLTKHIKNTHDWVKKKCDKAGCTDKTEFETGGEYFAHIRLRHGDTYEPTTCRIPPCDEREKPFVATSRENQRSHLANTHHFTKDKIKTILPPIVKKGLTGGAGWGVRPCPVLGCKAKSAMAVTNMRAHLQGKAHGMTLDEANATMDRALGRDVDA